MQNTQKINKIIILPGNECSNTTTSSWYFWLKTKLQEHLTFKIEIILPTIMPDYMLARKSIWLPYIKHQLKADENTLIIGHSSGSIAILKFLE